MQARQRPQVAGPTGGAYLQLVGDLVGQQVAQQDGRPQVKHEGHVKVLSNGAGRLLEGHRVLDRHDVDHQHAALGAPPAAGLLEVLIGLLVADVLVAEALGAVKLLPLLAASAIILLGDRLQAQLRPGG